MYLEVELIGYREWIGRTRRTVWRAASEDDRGALGLVGWGESDAMPEADMQGGTDFLRQM